MWYESDSGNSYIWLHDGDTAQWVQQNVQAAAPVNGVPVGTIRRSVIIANGTYTTPAGLKYLEVQCWGGGGAGGGSAATAAGQWSAASGGHGGALASSLLTAAEIGASQAMTIGGTPASGTTGGAGGDTAFGSLVVGKGGPGGNAPSISTVPMALTSPPPVQSTAGQIRGWTATGQVVTSGGAASAGNRGGAGGNTIWGGAGTNASAAGANTGSGGGGLALNQSSAAGAGGAGGSGIIVLKEYF
jgi:hypothetical protein